MIKEMGDVKKMKKRDDCKRWEGRERERERKREKYTAAKYYIMSISKNTVHKNL